MKRTFPSPLIRPQPRAELPSLFTTRRQVGITKSASGFGYIPIYDPLPDTPRTHQWRMANLDAVTIHVTDNTIHDRHPIRRIYSQADITPRKARLERERKESREALKSTASAIIGALILGAGVVAGFVLASFQ